MKMLIERGARFVPDGARELRIAREAILGQNTYRNDHIRLLAYAAEPAVIRKLLDAPKMQQAFGGTPDDVMRRLRINFGETEQ